MIIIMILDFIDSVQLGILSLVFILVSTQWQIHKGSVDHFGSLWPQKQMRTFLSIYGPRNSHFLASYGPRNCTILAISGPRIWNQKSPEWCSFWGHNLQGNGFFWSHKLPKRFLFVSGAINCQNGAVSGAINCQNGRQILYEPPHWLVMVNWNLFGNLWRQK